MKAVSYIALAGLIFCTVPLVAQDDEGLGEIIVTGFRRSTNNNIVIIPPPVIGLKRQADSAVRNVEIISDSRDEDLRKTEVQAMLLAAIDRAKRDGFSLVTGQFEIVEVTRANWKDQFPGLVINDKNAEDDAEENEDFEDDDDDDDESKPPAAFEDENDTTTIRLKVKTKLDGSIGNAQLKITKFVKSVPVTGRSQMTQKGGLALTIINPEQYRDEIYRRIAAASKHAATFYGSEYGLDVNGLDSAIAWKQVSNTDVFLYIPYTFTVDK
jgi:hypothetical protein